MNRQVTLLACVVSMVIVMGLASCDTTSMGSPLAGPDPITVALPFVEAVHLPAEVHAGQPFSITLDFSCDSNPLALRSPARPFPTADHWRASTFNHDGVLEYSAVIKSFRDLTQASSSLPVLTSVTYDFDPYPAGKVALKYLSASTREQGGMNITYDRQTQVEMTDASSYIKTLEITVLP